VNCPQCQATNESGSTFCASCGSPLASQPALADQQNSTSVAVAAFQLDLRRLGRVEQVVGGSSLVVLVSLFLPWFGLSGLGGTFSLSGVSVHGYLYLDLIVTLLVIAYLIVRAGWDQLPASLPIAHGPLLLIGTSLQFLLVLIAFADKPALLSWEIGAYLALIASMAAAAPVVVPAIRSWQASH